MKNHPQVWYSYLLNFDLKLSLYNVEVLIVQLLSLKEMNMPTHVQILDENIFISHIANTLGKGTNPIILPPAMGK